MLLARKQTRGYPEKTVKTYFIRGRVITRHCTLEFSSGNRPRRSWGGEAARKELAKFVSSRHEFSLRRVPKSRGGTESEEFVLGERTAGKPSKVGRAVAGKERDWDRDRVDARAKLVARGKRERGGGIIRTVVFKRVVPGTQRHVPEDHFLASTARRLSGLQTNFILISGHGGGGVAHGRGMEESGKATVRARARGARYQPGTGHERATVFVNVTTKLSAVPRLTRHSLKFHREIAPPAWWRALEG